MRQCCILAWSFTFYNVATFLWSQKQLLKGARWNSSSENIGKTLKKNVPCTYFLVKLQA